MSISVIRGDDNYIRVEVLDVATPIDISGDKVTFTIKQNRTDVDASAVYQRTDVLSKTADSVVGIHRIQIPNTLPVGKYFYDIQWVRTVSGNGGVVTLEISEITVSQDITISS